MALTTEAMKEMVDAQEKTAVAEERIADALEHIAGNLELVIDAGPAQRHGIRVKKTEHGWKRPGRRRG
jgi:hypothetical protein